MGSSSRAVFGVDRVGTSVSALAVRPVGRWMWIAFDSGTMLVLRGDRVWPPGECVWRRRAAPERLFIYAAAVAAAAQVCPDLRVGVRVGRCDQQ